VFEEYVPTIQTMFPVTSDMRCGKAESAMVEESQARDEVFDEAAKRQRRSSGPDALLLESPAVLVIAGTTPLR